MPPDLGTSLRHLLTAGVCNQCLGTSLRHLPTAGVCDCHVAMFLRILPGVCNQRVGMSLSNFPPTGVCSSVGSGPQVTNMLIPLTFGSSIIAVTRKHIFMSQNLNDDETKH